MWQGVAGYASPAAVLAGLEDLRLVAVLEAHVPRAVQDRSAHRGPSSRYRDRQKGIEGVTCADRAETADAKGPDDWLPETSSLT